MCARQPQFHSGRGCLLSTLDYSGGVRCSLQYKVDRWGEQLLAQVVQLQSSVSRCGMALRSKEPVQCDGR